jgi:hypothetical protein
LEIGCEDGERSGQNEDRVQWRALVLAVLNLRFCYHSVSYVYICDVSEAGSASFFTWKERVPLLWDVLDKAIVYSSHTVTFKSVRRSKFSDKVSILSSKLQRMYKVSPFETSPLLKKMHAYNIWPFYQLF